MGSGAFPGEHHGAFIRRKVNARWAGKDLPKIKLEGVLKRVMDMLVEWRPKTREEQSCPLLGGCRRLNDGGDMAEGSCIK